MKKQVLWTTLKYGLGIVLLALVVYFNWDPASGIGLKQALQKPIQVLPLIVALLICTASLTLTFFRWYLLVRAQGLPFTLANAFRLGLVGFFFNTFLPGSVGGDLVKAAFIAREQSRRTVAVATVIVDRVVGLWALIALSAVLGAGFWLTGDPSLTTNASLQLIVYLAWGITGGSSVTWLVLGLLSDSQAHRLAGRLEFIPKVGHPIAELWRAIWMYHKQRRVIGVSILMAMIGHVGFVLTFYFAAQVFQADPLLPPIPSLQEHFVLVPVGLTAQALVPTPGGLGAGEYGFGALYALIHTDLRPSGVLASLVMRMIFCGLSLIGYIIYLRMRPALRAPAKMAGVRSQESGVRSQESGVEDQESGVRSQASAVEGEKSEVRVQKSEVSSS